MKEKNKGHNMLVAEVTEIKKGFKKHFGVHNSFFSMVTLACGVYDFDLLGFESWLSSAKGYEMKEGRSLHDYILEVFGKEACDFIKEMINYSYDVMNGKRKRLGGER